MKAERIWVACLVVLVACAIGLPFAYSGTKIDKAMGGVYRENDVDGTSVPVQSVLPGDGVGVSTSGTARTVAVDASVVRTSRTVTVSAPGSGGGALSGNITIGWTNENGDAVTLISTNASLVSNSDVELSTVKAVKGYYDDNMPGPLSVGSPYIFLPRTVGQGTWTYVESAAYGHTLRNSTSADGDNFTYDFRCPTGTYTVVIGAIRRTSHGIADIYVDGAEIGSFDLYAASDTAGEYFAISNITLSTGVHTIKLQVDGKNGSSSDFFIMVNGAQLVKE